MKPQPRYQPGDQIGGRYLVHKALMGGMGEVYLCLDLEENYPFALKTFQQRYLTNPRLRKAFQNEVATWVALENHPNIVRCHYLDIVDNQPFMRLEWIAGDEERGTDLRGWLRRGPLGLRTALDILIGICRALQHAQRKQPGIVHCDLKPENILIARDGLAKVTDFGLAKIVQAAQLNAIDDNPMVGDPQTLCSINGGTPAYMAPEQWKGEVLDMRTDIYAIGCMLFEMLTGHHPFRAATISELCQQHFGGDIPKLSVQADRPRSLDTLLMACLAKSKKERVATIEALLEEFEQIYQEEFQATPRELPTLEEYRVMDYSNRGNVYHQLGRYDKALADHNCAVALDPTYARAYHNRGATLHNLGRHEDALADFNQVLDLDLTLDATYSNRALVYHALKQFDKALLDHEQAIALRPGWATAYANRGLTYYALQQFENALADYNRAIQLSPTYAKAYLHRGKLFYKQQEYKRALGDYNEVLALDPMHTGAYSDRGLVYAKLEKWQEALQNYNQALELEPFHVITLSNRGNLYVKLKRYEDAVCDFDQALLLDPKYAPAYNNRGDLYHILEEYTEALQDRTRSLELDPNLCEAYFNRGYTYAALGQYEQALSDFDRAIECNPDFAQAYVNKAITLDRLGQQHEALECYDKASELGLLDAERCAQSIRRQLAMEEFQFADSIETMKRAVTEFPYMVEKDFVTDLEQADVLPGYEQMLHERLIWLRQIVDAQNARGNE